MQYRESNKLPNQKSTQELLDALKNPEKLDTAEVPDNADEIYRFVAAFNIEPGKHKVPSRLLYKLYSNWTSKKKFSRPTFTTTLGLYLPTHSDQKNDVIFFLNKKALNVSADLFKYIAKTTQPRIKSKATKQHFDNFINYYHIKSGKLWVQADVLYYLYDLWAYRNKRKQPINRKNFILFCSFYYEMKQQPSKDIYFFRIDNNIMNHISPKEVDEIIKGRNAKEEKKGNKKK